DSAIVVCSPSYLQRLSGSLNASKAQPITVLHARNWPGIWEQWSERAWGRGLRVDDHLHFQSTSLCVQAALVGIGVAIVHAPLVVNELQSKPLVQPRPFGLEVEESYFAILGPARQRHAELFEGFVAWCHE